MTDGRVRPPPLNKLGQLQGNWGHTAGELLEYEYSVVVVVVRYLEHLE